MLTLDLFDYSDPYIVVKEEINAIDNNNDNRGNKKLTLKNNATFRSCRAKINNTFIDNAKHIDIVMPMYNLLGHSDNYSMTLENMWNYQPGEVNDDTNENDATGNYRINNKNTTAIKFFEYKTKITSSIPSDDSTPVDQTQKLFLF